VAKNKKLDLKEILLPTVSLFAICLVMTGALAAVNAVTEEPIAANLAAGADAARQEMFEGARFEDNGDYFTAMGQNGALLGYCVDTEAQGYGGVIQVTVGLDPQGGILKVQVVAADSETPGLGQKVKEEGFLKQFIGGFNFFLKGDLSFVSAATQIDGIASATYSSQGVAEAVNRALEIYREVIAQ
jgi:electron transport complex protein RnfG